MYGIGFTLQYASILSLPRSYARKISFIDELLSCSFCTGFWSGLFTYFLIIGIQDISICKILIYGFSSATVCYLIDTFITYLENTPSISK